MATKKIGVKKPTKVGSIPIIQVDEQKVPKRKLTRLEKQARRELSQSIRLASLTGGIAGTGANAGFGNASGGSISNADFAFYSPQLSTDFLELPQSDREKRELFRFWYIRHPIVGAAIDFHCFPPGAPVQMVDGTVRPIESLTAGDEIRNGLGERTSIIRTFKDSVNGPITRLTVRGIQGTVDCTENHPFLVYRSNQIECKFPLCEIGACKNGSNFLCKQEKCEGQDFGKPEFIFAKDLKEGDFICSPSMVDAKSSFNRNQLRLLGYYAAEGSLSRTERGALDRVVFTLNADEFDTIGEEIAVAFNEEYEHLAHKSVRSDSHSCEVRCYKKDFADFCYKHIGSGSRAKKLSVDIINSPREDILEFLGAYWNGDGSLTENGYVATTTSNDMAHQIYAMALKVGYTPTLHTIEPNGNTYRVIVPYHFYSEFSKYANFVQDDYERPEITRVYVVKVGSNTLRRIEKVETINYDGFVYNVEVDGVDDRKSYVAYGLSTHNTDVPMSKIRLSLPKGKDVQRNKQILHFFDKMCKKMQLFKSLYEGTHEYWLHGVCVNKGTLIRTQDGFKNIEDVVVNDRVLSHAGVYQRVLATNSRIAARTLVFHIPGIIESLRITSEHPLEVWDEESRNYVFKAAGDIEVGAYVKASYPTVINDTENLSIVDNTQFAACESGYVAHRRSTSDDKLSRDQVRAKLIAWIMALSKPTLRSCDSLAEEFGVPVSDITDLAAQLTVEIGSSVTERINPKGMQGSKTLWKPIKHIPQEWKESAKEGGTWYNFPTDIAIDNDFLYLFGCWLSFGGSTRDGIIFNANNQKCASKLQRILDKTFNRNGYIQTPTEHLFTAHISSPAFVSWWYKNFLKTPTAKSIPSWMSELPNKKQLHCLVGALDAINDFKAEDEFVFSTPQLTIALFFRDVLLRNGSIPSIDRIYEGSRPQYGVSTNTALQYVRNSPDFGLRIEKIEKIEEESVVYNLQVDVDQTYQAGLISTHNCFIFAEDHQIDIPEELLVDIQEEEVGVVDYAGREGLVTEQKITPKPKEEQAKAIREYVADKYQGWQRLQILPPEQVKLEVFQYTNKTKMELIPSEKDRLVVLRAQEQHDEEAAKIADDIPAEIRENLLNGQPIPLNTDPYDDFLCSSFCYNLSHKKSPYADRGISILERCLTTLVYQDKLRQAQTSIASRAMTPKRIVWADKMSMIDVEDLRDQVDQALIDPDFSIVTNFEVHWDEIGARDRLLDLSTEYEITNKLLMIGLRITESMLTGEASYSGERIHLDVMNTMYLLYREMVCEYVEQFLFAPVAEKKGFWETDEWGNRILLHPKLQFTRLALRDNSELQDYMFNLYSKGSLPISFILELLNIDTDDAFQQLNKDMFTPKDSTFNSLLTAMQDSIAETLATDTDLKDRLVKAMGLKFKKGKGGRYDKDGD